VKEKIKEDKASKDMDHGQLSKRKKTPTDALENLMEKKEVQARKSLKTWVMWT
jgi:hypothetical protein